MIIQILLFSFLAIIVGLGLTFLGYAAFRIILPIWGFFVGLWLGADLVAALFDGGFLVTTLGIILGLVFGVVLAGIAYYIYALAIILFGATMGYALGAGFMLMLGFEPGFMPIMVGIILAVLFIIAFVSMKMPKFYLMVVTAFAGATAIIAGILILFGQIPPSQLGLSFADIYIHNSWFWWLIWLVIGFFGTVTQYQLDQAAKAMIPKEYSYETFVADAEKQEKESKKS